MGQSKRRRGRVSGVVMVDLDVAALSDPRA